uniref:Protein aurora borealis n=1 Tax=Onchocerca flexuosa TaxID=387005 RepID=A0A183HCI6_9BILA
LRLRVYYFKIVYLEYPYYFFKGSFCAPASSVLNTASFHRQLSLRSYPDSPVKMQKQMLATDIGKGEPIFEDDEDKHWLNNDTLNEEITFENAPYCPVKHNGFRQSLSYTATPYANACDFSGSRTYSLVNSPLQVQTNYLSNVNGPESWLSNPISTSPSTAKSKADEWLEQTLRSSLSLNSPCKNTNDLSRTSHTIVKDGPPPDQPPPPLPSSSVYQSTGSETAIRFSSDFSQYELPAITENFSSLNENASVISSTTLAESEIDIFGQPVFSALLSNSQRNPKQSNQMNEYMNNRTSEKPEEIDPFDVKWSHLAVDVARTCPVSVRSTNPFYSESSAVKI